MPLALVSLAFVLATIVLLGPLGAGVIQWRVSAIGINQTYGADGVSLALVAPSALLAAWMWWRGRRLGAPIALGVGRATLYYAIASVLGADYARYGGNNERFFPMLLIAIVLSWTIAVRAWAALEGQPAAPPRWLTRSLGIVLLLGSVTIGLAWIRQIVDLTVYGALTGADALAYADAPGAFWLVRIVDLGFIIPMCLATGVGLWRDSAIAIKAAYGVLAFMTLQASSVLAMGTIMIWRGDPTATPMLIVALLPITLALGLLTARLLGSYRSRPLVHTT
jgi:hypothetical protein